MQVHPCRAEAAAGVGEEGIQSLAAWPMAMDSPLALMLVQLMYHLSAVACYPICIK